MRRAMWTCPECGVKFLNRDQWHSCGLATVDDWRRGRGARARALYERFEALVAACGEYNVGPAKTRIAFLGKVRFAGITSLSERGMTCSFALPFAVGSARFRKVEEVGPGWFVHTLRVREPSELDDEVAGWIGESYRLMGMRERLAE